MAEAAPAKHEAAAGPSSISLGISGAPVPLSTNASLSGGITFINLPPTPVKIWTWGANGDLANIFVGQTGNYVSCQLGSNGPFSFNSSVALNQSLGFQANSIPPSEHGKAHEKDVLSGVKGTIKITSMAGDEKK
jgi:hypothetical protein